MNVGFNCWFVWRLSESLKNRIKLQNKLFYSFLLDIVHSMFAFENFYYIIDDYTVQSHRIPGTDWPTIKAFHEVMIKVV